MSYAEATKPAGCPSAQNTSASAVHVTSPSASSSLIQSLFTTLRSGMIWGMISRTCTTFNNFVTTVATPRKNVGRVLPSIWWLYPFTSTNVPFCFSTLCEIPLGYISSTVGTNTAAAVRPDTETAERSSRSCGRVRGYVARSSCGANCAGLTKMERTVRSFSARERRTCVMEVRRDILLRKMSIARTEREVSFVQGSHRRDEPDGLVLSKCVSSPFTIRRDGREERDGGWRQFCRHVAA